MQHIGVIEDTDLVRELLVDLLEGRGYRVTACANLAAGREAFLAAPPHLLITDVHLPDGDGLRLLAELRKTHTPEDLPVLVLSGASCPEDVQRGRQAGATGVLSKPLAPSELLTRCAELLDRAGSKPS